MHHGGPRHLAGRNYSPRAPLRLTRGADRDHDVQVAE